MANTWAVDFEAVRSVWLVFKNTDDIEGRGKEYISHVCEVEATAKRLAKGKYVMGRDCPIKCVPSYQADGIWYQPSPVVPPSSEDLESQARLDHARSAAVSVNAAVDAARKLGLSDEHVKALLEIIPDA